MTKTTRTDPAAVPAGDAAKPQPAFTVRLPVFLDDTVGLGETVKRMTTQLGVPACGGCERRAATLDRWIAFAGRRR